LDEASPFGKCLELACGTGLWTPQLARRATGLTAIDAAPEAIGINRAKVGDQTIRYVVADLFEWQPTETYDFVFFGFWLSHVPAERFHRFWETVRAALKPGGRAFFVDSLAEQASTARDHAPINDSGVAERKLNDGRTFSVVKRFYKAGQLQRLLQALGWTGAVEATGQFFYHGCVVPEGTGQQRAC
jgi:demethylmenaquinone methyltransferase/2-methoxy-6-polyprenyl-1,4-benzoquinol methylase